MELLLLLPPLLSLLPLLLPRPPLLSLLPLLLPPSPPLLLRCRWPQMRDDGQKQKENKYEIAQK